MRPEKQRAVILMNRLRDDVKYYTTALCFIHVEVAMRPVTLV